MRIKKCGFLLSAVMLICFALPSFASAEGSKDLLGRFYEADLRNSVERYNLSGSFTIDRFYLRGTNNSASSGYVSIRLLDSNNQLIWSSADYKFAYPRPSDRGNEYNVTLGTPLPNIRYVELKGSGKVLDFTVFGKEYIPEITNLKEKLESTKVTFTWGNPVSEKVVSVNLYQDKKRIKTFEIKDNVTSYVIENLIYGGKYNFTFKTVDKEGRETTGISKNVHIPMPIISPPNNVFLTPQNKKLVIAWDDVKSPYLQGYNVYVDGRKVNDKPLTSSKLVVNNLENNKSYKVQISAVNKENLEGEKSKEVSEKPSSSALEVEYDVKMPFSPLDLLTSSVSLLAILGGFVLLSVAIIWFRPLKELIVKAVRREKDKK
ncbi:fibronectin type III domain-containing protein [Bacillus mycoides]|uniref:fibronectin type III domain-containing protein n=1 Tax=Bacillus mycoides TaxID=1405 RepID=UPI003D64583F